MMKRITTFFEQLKARNVRKTMAIYVSAGLTAIGIIKLFMEVYEIPAQVFTVTVTVLTIGAASAFLFAWQRGGTSTARSRVAGILLHSCFLTVAILLSYRVATVPRLNLIPTGSRSVVAVLPFTNLGNTETDEYFSDGMTEDILTQLSKIAELRVISRTSVMQYKKTTKPLREIGKELGAGSILEGSVRRIGDKVRIVSQLIDAQTDEHVWAETYDRDLRDVFAIQSEVARAIAEALKAALSPDEKKLLEKKPTENLEAYTLYLKGRQYYYRYTNSENDSAIAYFRRALALDPSYALAYAGLGDAFGQRVEKHGFDQTWSDSALAMCDRAIALDPNLAEPHKGRGVVYFTQGRFRKAMAEYLRAVEINPNYAPAVGNLGSMYWWTGQYDRSLPLMKKNVQLNPRASAYHSLALLYHGLEEDSLAESWFRNALELQPNFTPSAGYLIRMLVTLRETEKARTLAARWLQQFPGNRFVLYAMGDLELAENNLDTALARYQEGGQQLESAYIFWKQGRKTEAGTILKNIIDDDLRKIDEHTEEFTAPLELARIEAFRGNRKEALSWMEKAVDAGWLYYRLSLADPLLESIRSDPEFIRIMKRAEERVRDMRTKTRALEQALRVH